MSEPKDYSRVDGPCPADRSELPRPATSPFVQDVAAVAWRCIKECKDHTMPPVMCLRHQLEAESIVEQKAEGKSTVERMINDGSIGTGRDRNCEGFDIGSGESRDADKLADAIAKAEGR